MRISVRRGGPCARPRATTTAAPKLQMTSKAIRCARQQQFSGEFETNGVAKSLVELSCLGVSGLLDCDECRKRGGGAVQSCLRRRTNFAASRVGVRGVRNNCAAGSFPERAFNWVRTSAVFDFGGGLDGTVSEVRRKERTAVQRVFSGNARRGRNRTMGFLSDARWTNPRTAAFSTAFLLRSPRARHALDGEWLGRGNLWPKSIQLRGGLRVYAWPDLVRPLDDRAFDFFPRLGWNQFNGRPPRPLAPSIRSLFHRASRMEASRCRVTVDDRTSHHRSPRDDSGV